MGPVVENNQNLRIQYSEAENLLGEVLSKNLNKATIGKLFKFMKLKDNLHLGKALEEA